MPAISWAGDTDLAPHLMAMLAGGPIDVVVTWGAAVPFAPGTDRKALTRQIEAEVRALARE